MLAHSPEACKNATSSDKNELREKEWNRKENAFLALTCDVPVFRTLCAALVTLSPTGCDGTGRAADKVTACTEELNSFVQAETECTKSLHPGEKRVSQCT